MQKGWRLKIATELKDQDSVFLNYCEDSRLKLYTVQWAMTQAPVPHELGEESSRKFLEAYGILTKRKRSKAQHAKMLSKLLRPKHPRRPVLHQSKMRHVPPTYDAYTEAKEKEQEKDSQLMTMQEQMALIMAYLIEKDPEKKADISREPIEITC
jgi:hypothetical protein